jgi:hypothetical protein
MMINKMHKSLIGFFCMFLLITVLVTPAGAYNYGTSIISLTFNMNQALTDVWLLTGVQTNGRIDDTITQVFIGDVPSGINNYSFLVSGTPNVYTIMGLYDSINNGVTVAMQNVPYGVSWDNYFHPEYYQDWMDTSEASVSSHLQALDKDWPYWLEDFYCSYYLAKYGFGGIGGPIGNLTLVNFSDATFGGSAYADVKAPVPIPAAAWLFGSGLLGLVGLRRKFSK